MGLIRIRRVLLLLPLLLPGVLPADQLTLKNGDRVTGKIGAKSGDKVTFKSDLLGEITVPWSAVTSVTSDDPLTVVLGDNKSVVGRVVTSDGKVEVTTAGPVESSLLSEVSTIRNAGEQRKYERLLSPGWFDLWAGYIDLALATARGNARTNTLTTAFTSTRATSTDKTTLYFNQINARATIDGKSTATANAVRGGWAYNRSVSARAFVNTFNDYEFDKFQSLDLRFVLGGGLGFSAIKAEHSRLDLVGGMDYERESFSTPLKRNSAEAYWGDDASHKVSARASLRQSFRMFNNLTDTGVYRINVDVGADTNLWRWLAWQVSAGDRYLSAPVSGRQRNDILITTGFRITFAR